MATKSKKSGGTKKRAKPASNPPSEEPQASRKMGIRGAPPWAARHAAKHAAEARARAAEPAPPGSARATLRIPSGADEIKAKVGDLHNAIERIKSLRRNVPRNFFEIGLALQDIRGRKLYEARGFGTFEAFLDRELDLGKTTALCLVRIVEVFRKSAALQIGFERLTQAVAIIDQGENPDKNKAANATPLPMRPPPANKRR